jgi:methionyl-tRNA formyltransferase
MEWTILQGDKTGITTFFIDEGIDTGSRIVFRKKIDISSFRDVASAKAYLFSFDAEMYARALELLQRADFAPAHQGISDGKRYYVMSRLFTGVVERILNCPDEAEAEDIRQPKEQPAASSR